MIGCLRTRVRKQPIIALYFASETVLKFYNLEELILLQLPGMLSGPVALSVQFIKIISHYKKIGYNINVLQQTVHMLGNQPNHGWQLCFPL